ncbi:cytochrome b6-f complex subunit PetL [Cyanobacterium sp. uoEpiScrs1]|nr:cytochrome b6-f complex subunit PetL [Cyanobacterium sp. uoEpiScrs1]
MSTFAVCAFASYLIFFTVIALGLYFGLRSTKII